jgi:hypothetical protein
MKKLISGIGIVCTLLLPASLSAGVSKENSKKEVSREDSRYYQRLKEIRSMDLKNASRETKNELRKEVRQIKKEMKEKEPVLYISLGTALLIILILALLL